MYLIIFKESTHTVSIRYKGTSDVVESASTTITIKAQSNTALTELENAGFKRVNDLKSNRLLQHRNSCKKRWFCRYIFSKSKENKCKCTPLEQ